MSPKLNYHPNVVALIFIVIDFVAPVQYLSYFHTLTARQTSPISLITCACHLHCYDFNLAAIPGLLRASVLVKGFSL